MKKCTFSIFGDLAQSIYQYRGIENWEKVISSSFDGKCELKYLSKSYRTTTEIMNSANNITSYLGLNTAEPVIRHGIEVEYIETSNELMENIERFIKDYLKKGYSSIAIICKDEVDSYFVNAQLNKLGVVATNITSQATNYNGGLCTIASYLAKGLEFDGVIITDASESKYNSEKTIDMKLLYVAMTRALHELKILYNGELTTPLLKDYKKIKSHII